MQRNHFQSVGGVRPPRSAFDLSHDCKTTAQMGKLYPVMCLECYPGDKFTMFNEAVVRMQPMIAPILHQIDFFTHTFFVPYRLLWGSQYSFDFYPSEPTRAWEKFITGGENNDFATPLPRWNDYQPTDNMRKTLWDYLGYPMEPNGTVNPSMQTQGFTPLDFPRRAYNFIWNEYYRDQKLQDPIPWNNKNILNRCWEKDYFTIARPARQLGQALAIPLSGFSRVGLNTTNPSALPPGFYPFSGQLTGGSTTPAITSDKAGGLNTQGTISANMSDGVGTFDVTDLRQIFQLQKWQERNARAGVRYKEFIPAHFGVSIQDQRVDRPEYIGGTKSPVIISEVLQTEGSTEASPQANMAGHGIVADTTKIGQYYVREYGLIMTIMSIRPRSSYANIGLNRQWLRRTRYDFYSPEFAHLSEQAVYKGELLVSQSNTNNWDPFGYQGIFDELRYIPSYATGDMRNLLKYWHIARYPSSPAVLNDEFVKCNPRQDFFAVQTAPDPDNNMALTPVDNFIINYASRIKAVRPLPFIAEPGLVDHF